MKFNDINKGWYVYDKRFPLWGAGIIAQRDETTKTFSIGFHAFNINIKLKYSEEDLPFLYYSE